jgi:hypothetical protein
LAAKKLVFKYRYDAHTASDFAVEVSGKCGTSYVKLALLTELPTRVLSNMKYRWFTASRKKYGKLEI